MQAGADAAPHQRVPGGMELDEVDAAAARIMAAQMREHGVGEAREIGHLGRAPLRAMRRETLDDRLRQVLDQRGQNGIGGIEIGAETRRYLVCDLVRLEIRRNHPSPAP